MIMIIVMSLSPLLSFGIHRSQEIVVDGKNILAPILFLHLVKSDV